MDNETIKSYENHAQILLQELRKVMALPQGQLTKKAVFDAAATCLAKNCFPTPESKQELITELASLPDDEAGLRQGISQYIQIVTQNMMQWLQMKSKMAATGQLPQ